eukprot:14986178-Alexandrium_andersonii.AAC.1
MSGIRSQKHSFVTFIEGCQDNAWFGMRATAVVGGGAAAAVAAAVAVNCVGVGAGIVACAGG